MQHGGLYITGDNVYYRGLEKIGSRFRVSADVFHFGGSASVSPGRRGTP